MIDSWNAAILNEAVQNGGGATGHDELSEMRDVTITTPSSGNVLSYNGTKWVNSDPVIPDAEDIDYDNTDSGLIATNVQKAVDEVNTKVGNLFPILDGGLISDLNITDRVAGSVSISSYGSGAANKPGTGGGYVQTFINAGTTDFGRQISFGNEGIFTRALTSGTFGNWAQIDA